MELRQINYPNDVSGVESLYVLQDAVDNVSSVNEYIRNTVAKVKQYYNMMKRQQQMALEELSQHR